MSVQDCSESSYVGKSIYYWWMMVSQNCIGRWFPLSLTSMAQLGQNCTPSYPTVLGYSDKEHLQSLKFCYQIIICFLFVYLFIYLFRWWGCGGLFCLFALLCYFVLLFYFVNWRCDFRLVSTTKFKERSTTDCTQRGHWLLFGDNTV